jgi:hypothetical protein
MVAKALGRHDLHFRDCSRLNNKHVTPFSIHIQHWGVNRWIKQQA